MVHGNSREHVGEAKAGRPDPNEYRIGQRAHMDHSQIAPYDTIKKQTLFDLESTLVAA
jgi:hypothetical protein